MKTTHNLTRGLALMLALFLLLPVFAAALPIVNYDDDVENAQINEDEPNTENTLEDSEQPYEQDELPPTEPDADETRDDTDTSVVESESRRSAPISHAITQSSVQGQFVNTGNLIPIPTGANNLGGWRQGGSELGPRYNSQFFQISIGGNLYPAYCLEPLIPAPLSGTYAMNVLNNNTLLARGLFYAFGAPGQRYYLDQLSLPVYSETSHTGSRRGDTLYMLSHLTLSYIYLGGFGPGFEGISAEGRAAVLAFYNFIVNAPHPPHANKSFSMPTLTATTDGAHQITAWTTFEADHRNQIMIVAPAGAQVQADAGGLTQWQDQITIRGGERIRFRSTSLTSVSPGRWTSPPLQGTNTRQWLAVIFNQGIADTQTMGGASFAVDPVAPITLNIDWQNPYGALQIRKESERGVVYTEGISFRVQGTQSHNMHIVHYVETQLGETGGWVNVTGLLAGHYRIDEINVPDIYVQPPPQYVNVIAGGLPGSARVTFYNTIAVGSFQIRKISERGVAYTGGIEFRVEGVDEGNRHVVRYVETTIGGAGGWVNVSRMLSRSWPGLGR